LDHLDNYAGPEPMRQISDALLRRGRMNALGFPIYRLVRSEFIFEKVGGRWNDWDADLNVADRGGISTGMQGEAVQTHHRPDRVAEEVREVPTYSHLDSQGWVLERWYPASYFGSPEAWGAQLLPGTKIPLLGPFPSQGRYLMLVGPFLHEPDLCFLHDFISHWEQRRASFPDDVEQHIKRRTEDAIAREEERSQRAQRENFERLRDSVKPLTSTTLEAGRWRSKQFEKAGFTSHIGN
jgi:hypothetical protein